MPRRRRPARPVRRPNFQPAPQPTIADEDEDAPTFADEPAVTVPAYGATGPVETRPHWVSRSDRAQGRRLAQLRRSSGEERAAPRAGAAGQLPVYERAYITGELRRILITTVAMVALVLVLAVLLR
jgi:hypothetical protein